jgi:hypothetical protein
VKRALALLVIAACGDAIEVPPVVESLSGTRIKRELYLFDDGTRLVDPAAFYDTHQHTRCQPRRWGDGIMRCVPIADAAVFTDAACTTLVGIAPTLAPRAPTHFLGIDTVDGAPLLARLYRAGVPTDAVAAFYTKLDGACVGPQSAPIDASFYEVGDELPASAMAELAESQLGEGRVALRMMTSSDGMQVTTGVIDRSHDLPCTPRARGSGVACEPSDAAPATRYLDSTCMTPVVTVGADSPAPLVASAPDADGCATYFTVGTEVQAPLYRQDATGCVRVSFAPQDRAFQLAPIDLAQLDATVANTAGHRLAPVELLDPTDPALRFTGEQLVDRAIDAECEPAQVGEAVRCQPVATQLVTTLYTAGCAIAVPVIELPERACRPTTFASATGSDGPVFHAVGPPATEPLYRFSAMSCVQYTPEPGRVVHLLGPPLPPDTFVGAVKYGER